MVAPIWRRHDPDGARLVAECEAFLAGTLSEDACESAGRVPVWYWVNLLAHGDADQLRAIHATPTTQRDRFADWRVARSFLAGEVLDRVEPGGTTLPHLQRDALVPLELNLLSQRATRRWSPGDLVTATLAILPDRSPRRKGR